ncbi:MAG: 4-demethylwyosine synthase TYW1 [Candidatus Parvarchaeota archaeon]|nr:4-demethylwyosine synthase TYW1 [Candidatus Jingweiarchaeum tengchongense]MCW1297692.1 4-demethylwyosine synthase TYW1 [Candidatus Jingweiarchaeum tengchongense]MCW1299703.1 4-demethylwyosine synthase TYW1 [Candidatus Jingweiarchaeum tengchongense]MCW1304329.1 4-demethylwyosine synthase TYW1 [Candidatus Jingweiarchaeum tengchongense]MCW1305688.1 4-demethylwyosine synthase TYW1 [Candidatus Jingweiarchaeum tengchongense]
MDEALIKLYQRQGYKIIGKYGAVKLCLWTKKSILNRGFCYKQQFYGIQSHRCLQMTPNLTYCTQSCIFCWRSFQGTEIKMRDFDEPQEIVEKSIEAQRSLLIGYKGDEKADKKKVEEAFEPKHVAISLAGEPTLYPKISELIKYFHQRKMTTFLVSNGTNPDALLKMEPPTQLYITLAAPNENIYKKTCQPLVPGNWDRLNKTLEILPSIKTRKVIRLTLVKGLNMTGVKGYAELIKKASPNFVEVKAYMRVGFSRERLGEESMPRFEEIKSFADKLSDYSGYKIIDDKKDSRVVLLSAGNENRFLNLT